MLIRTWRESGKFKRIANNDRVTVCPSGFFGDPVGDEIEARARVLTGEEALQASEAIAGNHPFLHRFFVPIYHRLRGFSTAHLELVPVE